MLKAAMTLLAKQGAETGQPQRSFEVLAQFFADKPGYMLFSISLLENATWLRRIMSTDPSRHKPNGIKDMAGTGYCDAVILRREHLLSRNEDDLRANFQDHAAIIADGVGSAVNLSLQFDGRVVGSANFLGKAGAYDQITVDYLSGFAFPLAMLVTYAASKLPAAPTQDGVPPRNA